jgi:DNA-binding LacI/PurR family transcriptional regulator
LANVSTATVSHLLQRRRAYLGQDFRQRCRKAAAQLGYRPNPAARNLARGRIGVVLYVVPSVGVGIQSLAAASSRS